MNRLISTLAATLLLTACAGYEGVYEPSCIAYEGDRIELRAGLFEWDRFTDQYTVGVDGELVDAFPEFPKSGHYTLESGRLKFVTNDGVRLDDWFLVEQDGRKYLLTGDQYPTYSATDTLPPCALKLTNSGG